MDRNSRVFAAAVIIILAAIFCWNVKLSSAMSSAPGIYQFFGRVLNQEDKPLSSCTVLLMKGVMQEEEKQSGEEAGTKEKKFVATNEEMVAATDEGGNFAFAFEPLTAENFWVFFQAEGYRTRAVELNKLMRSRFFQQPNKSPIRLDVVLEKD